MPLEVKSVTKEYGGKKILERFSLLLPSYGNFALLGPSGCGKTTLLRLISGLETPDSGSVTLPDNSRLSCVFQEDRLLPALTASGNIAAVLTHGERANKVLASRWLDRVGLKGEDERYPAQLSGGMKRRVAIARALAFGGDILILDEPFSGLDMDTKNKMQSLVLSGLDARVRLNILVTHDIDEAIYSANKIILLSGPPLRIRDMVSVDIPVEKRRGAEDVLMWHKEYIVRKLSGEQGE